MEMIYQSGATFRQALEEYIRNTYQQLRTIHSTSVKGSARKLGAQRWLESGVAFRNIRQINQRHGFHDSGRGRAYLQSAS